MDYMENRDAERAANNRSALRWVIGCTGTVLLFIILWLMFAPEYRIYSATKRGQAQYQEAEHNRRIKVLEAQAKMDAALLEQQAEVIRATGAAQANAIIDSSLTEQYLRYLWITGLDNGGMQVIYVPTEANLPILEAGHRPLAP